MVAKTRGIVLHAIKYGDTSLVVKIFTEHFGVRSYLVNGVFSKHAKMRPSLFQPLQLLELVVYQQEKKSLQRIKEVKLFYTYTSLPYHVQKTAMGLFIAEVLHRGLQNDEPNSELFEFTCNCCMAYDAEGQPDPDFHIRYLLHASKILGFEPLANFANHTPYFSIRDGCFVAPPFSWNELRYFSLEHSQLLAQFLTNPLQTKTADLTVRRSFLQAFIQYLQHHWPGIQYIRSNQVLMEMFDDLKSV